MTLISPGGSTMQCGRWLWDDMPLNSPNVRHIGILHLVSIPNISPQSTCHSASLRNFIQIGPLSAEKNDVMSIFKIADINHLGFYGSNNGFFEKPNYITYYRSSIDTIALNCLVFQKIAFLHFGVKIQDNRISAILDFRELIMGSVKSPCTTSYRSSIA